MTRDQSLTVCAVGVAELAVLVLVPVGVLAVLVGVPVGVLIVLAPSSRKIIKDFAHQLILLKACVEEVGVGAAPPNGLEQALKKRHTRKIPAATERPRRLLARPVILPASLMRILG